MRMLGRTNLWLAALAAFAALALPAAACPFCGMQNQQTLTVEVGQASLVVYGTLGNARLNPDGGFGQGSTELRVEGYLKTNPQVGEPKVITLPRYLPTGNDTSRFLVF